MNELPEECIAKVMSYLGPQQACRLASVSRTFSSASQSDVLWESFLPSDYRSIISQSSDPSLLSTSASKQHLFRRLCQQPVLLDQGKKSWAVEAGRGKISMMVGARDLAITWGDTPAYWRWETDPDSRFAGGEVAALELVWWLEIRAKIQTRRLSPGTTYGAYLVFKLMGGHIGFAGQPVKVGVGFVGDEGSGKESVANLDPAAAGAGGRSRRNPPAGGGSRVLGMVLRWVTRPKVVQPRKRGDRWWEVKLGEFENGVAGGEEVEVSVKEVESGQVKHGLVVHGIEFRPE
ncbi:unnamed protein product [Linum tenue]|uniref:F-box domain-containing protein n=1 Tax=Linum tenue TaxID=586396 RepID=A0AAV0QKP3_9ROSI|nr:unnamed protein product [Linum tenue]